MLSDIRDVDRLILNKLNDNDFLQMCSLNKTYSERVCDETYFRLRTEARFPETIPYKDYVNEKNKTRTWKNHYLTIVKYIDLLKKNYGYIYKKEDKSPELLYLAIQLVRYSTYTKNKALNFASINGKLPLVRYLVEQGVNVTAQNNEAVIYASEKGHLSVVKYLTEHGADITAQNNLALRWASEKGHLEIVKYLIENGVDITVRDNYAVRWAKLKGHYDVVEYLYSLQSLRSKNVT